MVNILILTIMMVLSFRTLAQQSNTAVSDFFKDKTKIENPFELRDPFKAPVLKSEESEKKQGFYKTSQGVYSNLADQELTSVAGIKVIGVMVGKERRAMVKTSSSRGMVLLKEGMKFGEDGAELKAILPGGIIIVEKMINVYGQEEYLETVIPISK